MCYSIFYINSPQYIDVCCPQVTRIPLLINPCLFSNKQNCSTKRRKAGPFRIKYSAKFAPSIKYRNHVEFINQRISSLLPTLYVFVTSFLVVICLIDGCNADRFYILAGYFHDAGIAFFFVPVTYFPDGILWSFVHAYFSQSHPLWG